MSPWACSKDQFEHPSLKVNVPWGGQYVRLPNPSAEERAKVAKQLTTIVETFGFAIKDAMEPDFYLVTAASGG